MNSTLVYLACPYIHPDTRVRAARTEIASFWAGLMSPRQPVYSPLSHAALIHAYTSMSNRDWIDVGLRMVGLCDALHVLCLPGWESSTGVQEERALAAVRGMPEQLVTEQDVGRAIGNAPSARLRSAWDLLQTTAAPRS